MIRSTLAAVTIGVVMVVWPHSARALERLCDPAHEDCRAPLLDLIDRESQGIDVAFWFMEDTRYASALIRAQARGVRVRVLMDTRANRDYPGNIAALEILEDGGVPMREKVSDGVLHWKMMQFAAQNTVQFSGANYSDEAFVPIVPYVNYVDEIIYFTDRPSYVDSFRTMFDNVWTAETGIENYANVVSVARAYAVTAIDPDLNFPPGGFRERSVAAYRAESSRIDAIMYRITDRAHTDALIDVALGGVPLRLISEPLQYRDPTRLWHAWNVDRLYAAGQSLQIDGEPAIHIRHRRHAGLTHEKLTLLRGQGLSIYGSSNWTSASNDRQIEHNLFTRDTVTFDWVRTHFERKWFNRGPVAETQPFVPLPPDDPQLLQPSNGMTSVSRTTATLQWNGGPWAHRYDIYLGTDPANLPLVVQNQEMGPYGQTWTPKDPLLAGTVYYWRVVGRTMANLERSSPTCSFKTDGPLNQAEPLANCLQAPPHPTDPVAVDEPQDLVPLPGGSGGSGVPGQVPGEPSSESDSMDPPDVPARRPSPDATYTGTTAIPRQR